MADYLLTPYSHHPQITIVKVQCVKNQHSMLVFHAPHILPHSKIKGHISEVSELQAKTMEVKQPKALVLPDG